MANNPPRQKFSAASIYDLGRAALFRLEPETAHGAALTALRYGGWALPKPRLPARQPIELLGLRFANPIGLAAGLDKNGDYIDALAKLGFGFIEVGTVTPRPQPGNPRPRVFRLAAAEALINRLGFNNKGVDYLVERLRRARYPDRGILGVNIGKNRSTPPQRAADDYLSVLAKVYPYAHYVTVNVSSPNTPGLRELQHGDSLDRLLQTLKAEQGRLADRHQRYVPLLVKIAPDLDREALKAMAAAFIRHAIDGVIATNTTLARDAVAGLPNAEQDGGLSGAPLAARATEVVRQLAAALDGALPIIGVGGILDGAGARAKIAAGASLVQIYTGLIYRGPALIEEIAVALLDYVPERRASTNSVSS